MPPVSARLDLLFRVWVGSDGAERSNDSVARAVSRHGVELSTDTLVAAREGAALLDSAVLGAIATEFGIDGNYLLSDEANGLHEQLVLLQEVSASGIKGIHLRGGDSEVDAVGMAELLRELRGRSSNN